MGMQQASSKNRIIEAELYSNQVLRNNVINLLILTDELLCPNSELTQS